MILRDGNNTIYPIAKDCADAIRDPNWLDLTPINCIGAATIPIPSCSNSTNLKNQVAVIALAFDNLLLMPRILRCDYESVKQVFCNLEQDLSKYNKHINVSFFYTLCIGNFTKIHMRIIFFYFVENNLTHSSANLQIQMILKERCDGNRNILHACVNMCSPTSNKETEQGNVFSTVFIMIL